MSHSPDAEDFIVIESRAALEHAGVDEADFHLITCPGAPVDGEVKGVHFPRGQILYVDPDEGGIVVQEEKLIEANASENLARRRSAVYDDVDPDDKTKLAYLAGLLRHEIEHWVSNRGETGLPDWPVVVKIMPPPSPSSNLAGSGTLSGSFRLFQPLRPSRRGCSAQRRTARRTRVAPTLWLSCAESELSAT